MAGEKREEEACERSRRSRRKGPVGWLHAWVVCCGVSTTQLAPRKNEECCLLLPKICHDGRSRREKEEEEEEEGGPLI